MIDANGRYIIAFQLVTQRVLRGVEWIVACLLSNHMHTLRPDLPVQLRIVLHAINQQHNSNPSAVTGYIVGLPTVQCNMLTAPAGALLAPTHHTGNSTDQSWSP
jgi:hypothetical protein